MKIEKVAYKRRNIICEVHGGWRAITAFVQLKYPFQTPSTAVDNQSQQI